MNDEPTPPAFFRPATPKKKEQLRLLNDTVDVGLATGGSSPGQPPEDKADYILRGEGDEIVTRVTDAEHKALMAGERRYTLGEALKIMSGLRDEDRTAFALIASTLDAMPADGRKRVIDTLRRIFNG
jgi:hypothetical protein